jgi:hypothetical protein
MLKVETLSARKAMKAEAAAQVGKEGREYYRI